MRIRGACSGFGVTGSGGEEYRLPSNRALSAVKACLMTSMLSSKRLGRCLSRRPNAENSRS